LLWFDDEVDLACLTPCADAVGASAGTLAAIAPDKDRADTQSHHFGCDVEGGDGTSSG
jgi:hypothetical protein